MKNILEVKNISKIYQAPNGEVPALNNVNFKVKQGEFVSIVGPSGCGKSTLLSIISGLENPTYGKIYIENEEINGVSSHIGYMLQNHNLLEWRDIWSNVTLGLEVQKKLTKENLDYVEELLKFYEIDEFKHNYPNQLSGGMCQRAALIRTLAVKPKILLLDEAFSALDYQTRISIVDYVYKKIKEQFITCLMVTHDIPESISMSDRVIVLSNKPGTIKKEFDINFEIEDDSPLARRNHPKFSGYFNLIWKELGINEKNQSDD
ncbi:MAG: ABC transporter ATP-binding protein [Clostridiales bacterium]|nr:ABC transporter ATP-binding protein [Clostridiales bacterium]